MSLVDKILLEADIDIMHKKIKNPATGREIQISSALNYPDSEPVKKKALRLLKKAREEGGNTSKPEKTKTVKEPKQPRATPTAKANSRSHKPKSNSYGISKECVEFLKAKGLKGLNAYPQAFVKPEEIQFNPQLTDSNSNTIWVAKFPVMLPNGNKAFKTAYTAGFMKKSQVKKYKKISKIKESDIQNLEDKTQKLLNHKEKEVSDSACVLGIILKTGLRIGSLDEAESGNIGVRTLKKENIIVKGNKISLKFIGKSYQENFSEFEDANIAAYLKKQLEGKQDKENAFSCSYGTVGTVMKKINPKGINPKDLRTYKATQFAKKLLQSKELGAPPPLPEQSKETKKLVKEKLKAVFEGVAKLLSNTPGMAKNSYVHPVVITDYLDSLGLTPQFAGYKHVTLESISKISFTSMDQMFEKYKNYGAGIDDSDISDEDSDDCEEYKIPEWFYNDEIDLVKK